MSLDRMSSPALPRARGGPPQAFVNDSLSLAEQLLDYAEVFASEGDFSAACAQARCAVEGLGALYQTRPFADEALVALFERARHELGLYEARWAMWQQENNDRHLLFDEHERLALKKVTTQPGFVLDKTEFRSGPNVPVRLR